MIKCCKQNNESVLSKTRAGNFDYAHIASSNLVDDIISIMNTKGILQCLEDGIPDFRAKNRSTPYHLILAFIIAAKMRQKMSLTDIPTAITDSRLLGELGYNLIDTDGNLGSTLMTESGIRYIFDKYNTFDLFHSYNRTVQNHIMPKLNLSPHIHIVDCTTVEVNIRNNNYEWSNVGKNKDNVAARGYKLATIRGISYDAGFIEEINWGQIKTHDIDLSREMIMNSSVLKPGDILICDRGFIDRKLINYLKTYKCVDTYQPIRNDMLAYEAAIEIAKMENKWIPHPNKKRKSQKIAFVPGIGQHWFKEGKCDVEINACVVKDESIKDYFVFITTDLTKSAKEIIKIYELRPEIEEQYRQLKAFWKLEKFTCTKLNKIAFHIVFTLFAYLFYELYIMMAEGEKYQHKSLPHISKKYRLEYVILYSGDEFAIILITELLDLYSSCEEGVRKKIKSVLSKR